MPLNHTPPKTSYGGSEPNLPTSGDTTPLNNVTLRRGYKRSHDEEERSLKEEFAQLLSNYKTDQDEKFTAVLKLMSEIKEQNLEIRKSMEYMSNKYDDLLSKVSSLEEERKHNLKYIATLESKIENIERYSRSSSLIIKNVYGKEIETKSDLIDIIMKTVRTLNIPMNEADVRDIYRISAKSEIKPILVDFTSVLQRDNLIQAVKRYNQVNKNNRLSTFSLNMKGESKPIFFNEYLSTKAQKLFYEAREFAKINDYAFCWSQKGRIFIRRRQGEKAIRIEREEDLKSFKK